MSTLHKRTPLHHLHLRWVATAALGCGPSSVGGVDTSSGTDSGAGSSTSGTERLEGSETTAPGSEDGSAGSTAGWGDTGSGTTGAAASDSDSDDGAETTTGARSCATWIRQGGTSFADEGNGVAVDSEGNAYVVGTTRGDLDGNISEGGADVFISKYALDGTVLWTRQIGSPLDDLGYGVMVDGGDSVYVTGGTYGDLDGVPHPGDDADVFVAKYTPDGTRLWLGQFGGAPFEAGVAIAGDDADHVYVTGRTYGELEGNPFAGNADVFVTQYSADGTRLWTRQFGTSGHDFATAIVVDGAGDIGLAGSTSGDLGGEGSAGSYDAFVAQLGADGTLHWTRQLGAADNEIAYGIVADPGGDLFVTGFTHGDLDGNDSAGNADMFLTKYASDGTRQWTRQLGTIFWESGNAIAVGSAGELYIAGQTSGQLDGHVTAGAVDIIVTRHHPDGASTWTAQLGSELGDVGRGVAFDGADGIFVTGLTAGGLDGNVSSGNDDLFVAHLCPSG